jgi:hypothetical protein
LGITADSRTWLPLRVADNLAQVAGPKHASTLKSFLGKQTDPYFIGRLDAAAAGVTAR